MTESELKKIWHLHHNGMVKYAYKFTERSDVAEDIVQDVFISLWMNYEENGGKGGEMAYVRVGVKRKCLDYQRHLNTAMGRIDYIKPDDEEIEDKSDSILISSYVFALLDEQIENLPHQCKSVFSLALKGFDCYKIGEMLGISRQTALNQRANAVNKLKAFVHNNKLI